jgi:uncharacterized protein (TIGR00255 family)
MRIRSMTGYGRGDRELAGWQVVAEMRSVNHRGLDLRFVAPPALNGLEAAARQEVREACQRGRLECRVTVEAPPREAVSPDLLAQAVALHSKLAALSDHLGLSVPLTVRDLLAAGLDLHPSASEPPEGLAEVALEAVVEALGALVRAREAEGDELRTDFTRRLERLVTLVGEIQSLAAETSARYRAELGGKLRTAMSDLGLEGLDWEQLKQELVTLLDRSDITEEVVRARTHASQLLSLLSGDERAEKPFGKRLDFFLQELIREANTMASKSMSAELTARVVDVKVEIERMREQAQNVE